MSTHELEAELRRARRPEEAAEPSGAPRLTIEQALARRDAGNLPDERGRSLRLVLHLERPGVPGELESKRLVYEPDFHEAPTWRRAGSVPVNVVPLLSGARLSDAGRPWFEQPDMAPLEEEWRATGAVHGLRIPAAMRGLVFKTIAALRRAGRPVTVDTVSDSVSRWLPPPDVAELRRALADANPRGDDLMESR